MGSSSSFISCCSPSINVMLDKIKDNLGLIATAIALMGSVGAGLSTAGDIVNTLQNIDDRMNQVEVDFEMLKESTFVQGDIAVLFEKVQKLEIANDTNQYVQIEKWEWDDMKTQITRLESQLMDQEQDLMVVREIQTRLAWIEANCCR
jgi:ABC-type Na+ transport system ATPase subunit NatA